jgi:hypothetical protein
MRNRMLDWLTGNRPLMVLRYVLLTLIWLSVSTGLSLVSDLMPCFELSESAAAFYRFPHLSIGALVFYVAQMLIGYFFTTKVVIYWNVTLWKESRNFCAVLFVVIPMYFIGPIFVLNGPCDGDEVAFAARALDSWIRLVACFAVQLYIAQYWTLLDFIEGEEDATQCSSRLYRTSTFSELIAGMPLLALNMRFIRQWGSTQWTALLSGLFVGLSCGA